MGGAASVVGGAAAVVGGAAAEVGGVWTVVAADMTLLWLGERTSENQGIHLI